jgi:hypothetical protein
LPIVSSRVQPPGSRMGVFETLQDQDLVLKSLSSISQLWSSEW